jgi:hypothetical protein
MSNETNRVFGNSEQPQFPDLIKAGLKVGDTVYSYIYGDGVVYRFTKNETYPISVKFNGMELLFMSDGKRSTLDLIPSIHIHPWNPVAGEPFPFPKFEPIVGEVYAFWDNRDIENKKGFSVNVFKQYIAGSYFDDKCYYQNCAPISEALRIFGFDKVGEGRP